MQSIIEVVCLVSCSGLDGKAQSSLVASCVAVELDM
jgi:hypothetical protein